MKLFRSKFYWCAAVFIILAVVGYVGSTYASLRSVDHHMPLVVLSLLPKSNVVNREIVDFELTRRISNGEFDGVMVLMDTLSVGALSGASHQAIRQRVEWLLDDLVGINQHSILGLTPLHIAVANNDLDAARFLIELGAEPSVKAVASLDGSDGSDAIEFAQYACNVFPDRDYSQLIRLLETNLE